MIKYFYYEEYYKDGSWYFVNEKILDEKPETDFDGYRYDGSKCYIDLDKFIKHHKKLDKYEQEVYDRLLLQERNNKLETL